MHKTSNDVLMVHVPSHVVDHVKRLISDHRIGLRITRQRLTKLGDFKPSQNGTLHKISINGNLNQYEFLLVFLHELAHLRVYEKHGPSCRPHGKEWKNVYGSYIREFIELGFFHRSLHTPLLAYSYRIKAGGVADMSVSKILRDFDRQKSGQPKDTIAWRFLEEIPEGSLFKTPNGRVFRKAERLRTRYTCRCQDTRRFFIIHREARIIPVEDS